ncbi:four helix bundle protein [Robertmurraya sp. DFI.2.37]|uniref:four helix bundle protein n=1 Tax=Robertmurraya sp. DFI.2.37 TaxID=3031819 RepID=UPI001243BF5D|nr:four helix bundle protein [Robertmurraya sp. DFI.2.37]MDF1510662.1 four helix bundle protein [Robertmurraya sp. DFI.2.37]
MTKVENFRTFNLYSRSINLTMAINQATNLCKEDLIDKEVRIIRKKAVIISIKIAAAIAQVNVKVRFRKLNEAKSTIIQLRAIMLEMKKRKKIDEQLWQKVDDHSVEVLKLLHGYFGWMKRKRSLSNK